MNPPRGTRFTDAFDAALQKLANRSMSRSKENPIVVRMLFSPKHDYDQVINTLTKNLPDDANNLHIYAGSWLKGLPNMNIGATWNHAKMIAVDGIHLMEGGTEPVDDIYLGKNPVHDLSVHIEGDAAYDAHHFADQQWQLMTAEQQDSWMPTVFGLIPSTTMTKVSMKNYPRDNAPASPPQNTQKMEISTQQQLGESSNIVPIISVGRQGGLYGPPSTIWPSDDAILAMINSSQSSIRLAIQDMGPSDLTLMYNGWPKHYMSAFASAIVRGVEIQMVLSNPFSKPGSASLIHSMGFYGYGWTCSDVASEIIKAIQEQEEYSDDIDDAKLRSVIKEKLKLTYIRHNKSSTYEDNNSIGLHSKHWIVDDKACYIGSQNLYESGNLADWGLVIDHEEEVLKIKNEYFVPMWRNSYTGEDVDLDKVMDGLKVGGRDEDV